MYYVAGILQHTVNPERSENSVVKGVMSPFLEQQQPPQKTPQIYLTMTRAIPVQPNTLQISVGCSFAVRLKLL